MDSIKLVLAIAALKKWKVHHMDVKTTFMHGDLEEDICMKYTKGYTKESSLVCKLSKTLHGMKKAP